METPIKTTEKTLLLFWLKFEQKLIHILFGVLTEMPTNVTVIARWSFNFDLFQVNQRSFHINNNNNQKPLWIEWYGDASSH